jgi:hypothetical protein
VRPSTVARVNDEKVSMAYFEAVYSVLTGKVKAEDAGRNWKRSWSGFPVSGVSCDS